MSKCYIVLALVLAFAPGSFAAPAGSSWAKHQAKSAPTSPVSPSPVLSGMKAAFGTRPAIVPSSSLAKGAPSVSGGLQSTSLLPGKQLLLPDPAAITAPGVSVFMNEGGGVPRKIEISPRSASGHSASAIMKDPQGSARAFLAANKDLLKIKDPDSEFATMSIERDPEGVTHVRLQQMFAGIEVWASDVYVHVSGDRGVTLFNGNYHPSPVLADITPSITDAAAVQSVRHDLTGRAEPESLAPALARLLNDQGPSAKEVIWHDRNDVPHLAYFVEIRTALDRDWYYFVDAHDGSILHRYNNTMDDGPATGSGTDLNGVSRSFGTYAVGSTSYMVDAAEPMYNAAGSQIPQNPVGAIVILDLQGQDLSAQATIYSVMSSNNQWLDRSSVSALYNGARVYNFYRQVYGRNSIDNKGMTIYSLIHVTSNGQPMDNAFWSGSVMCYGDGNTAFKPLAGGFDVAAHEMTHGVTQNSANLVYQDQSGALNESMSDVFAAVVDSANWTIGEQVIKDLVSYPSGSLRDLSHPHNGGNPGDACWQPENMSEFISTTNDHGGVHGNSGIPNYAFYHVAVAIGRSPAAAIWYRALTHYLTSSAQFVDARIATEAAAKELYGDPSSQLTAVKNGWDAVGVTEGTGTKPPATSQLNGANWVLALNTASSDPNSLYMIKPSIQSAADFQPLSQSPVLNRPAVSDTSGVVLFVGTDYRLHALSANPSNPGEVYLDTNSVWWSVAVGPGLSRIALTSRFADTTIYYIDFAAHQTKQFRIQTMAFDGTYVKTALYADALSFDPTGRYLLFDSFNKTRTAQGDTISFWEIDMLDVTTGAMRSVFPPQSDGIDVGNPSFAKTVQYRFTFDYWNSQNSSDYVLATNLFTGKTGVVAGPLPAVGFPTYSGNDDTVAFHTTGSPGGSLHDLIQKAGLDTSFIAASGPPVDYVIDATFPVWFVIGDRTTDIPGLPSAGVPNATLLEQNYPNPFNPATNIRYSLPGRTRVTLAVFNTLGQLVSTLVNENQDPGYHEVKFEGAGLASGVYFYRLQAGSFVQTKKLILLR